LITPLGVLTAGVFNFQLANAIAVLGQIQLDLQAKLNASISAGVSLPAFDIQGAITALAALQASLALGLSPPAFHFNADVNASLTAQLALILPIMSLAGGLSLGGLSAYAFSGDASLFGSQLGTQLAVDFPAGGAAQGLALMATSPAAWASLGLMVKTK
jgi:hypothetical protein